MPTPRGFAAYSNRNLSTTHAIPLPSSAIATDDVAVVSVVGGLDTLTVSAAIDGVTQTPILAEFSGHSHRVYHFRVTSTMVGNTLDLTLSSARRVSAVAGGFPNIAAGTYLQVAPAGTTNTNIASTTKTTPAATATAGSAWEIAILGDTEGTQPGTTGWTPPAGMTVLGGDYHENGGTATPLSSTAIAYNPTLQANGTVLGSRVFTQNQGAPGTAFTLIFTATASPPTGNAGTDLTDVEPGSTVTLSASGGGTYQWVPDSRLGFSSTTIANPSVFIPPNLDAVTYTNTVTVTNSGVTSAPDTMTITALPTMESTYIDGVKYPFLVMSSPFTVIPPATRAVTDVSGLVFDLDVASLSGLSNGAAVASWTSSVGTGSATQGTGANQPTYNTGYNGKTAVVFDGTSDWLQLFGDALTATNNKTGITVFLVAYPTGARTSERVFLTLSHNTGGDHRFAMAAQITSGDMLKYSKRLDADSTVTFDTASPVPLNAWEVLTVNHDWSAATAQYWKDGTSQAGPTASGTSGSTSSTNSLNAFLGCMGGAFFYGGGMVRVLIFNRTLTAGERATVHSIIQDTYAITVSDYVSP